MTNIQDILDKIQTSKVNNLRDDQLATIIKRKKIYEYDKEGNIVNVFQSAQYLRNRGIRIRSGELAFSIHCSGRVFSRTKFVSKEQFISVYKKKSKYRTGNPVIQCDSNGVIINKFISIKEAATVLNLRTSLISRSIQTGYKTGGFIFKNNL